MNRTLSGNSRIAMKENTTWEVSLGASRRRRVTCIMVTMSLWENNAKFRTQYYRIVRDLRKAQKKREENNEVSLAL